MKTIPTYICVAVYRELIKNMSENIFNSDLGLAITGVAGNQAVEKHESGTLFLSITDGERFLNKEMIISGDRIQIKNRAVFLAFALINEFMLKK